MSLLTTIMTSSICSQPIGDRSHFLFLLLFQKKCLQLLLLFRSSFEIYTPTPVSTLKTWKQFLFCHMRQKHC